MEKYEELEKEVLMLESQWDGTGYASMAFEEEHIETESFLNELRQRPRQLRLASVSE